MKHEGSCLCGKVKFEIIGDFENFYLCHCERCRKDTGSAHGANLFSSTATIKWLSGEEFVRVYNFNSTGHIKGFCKNCGSALPNLQMEDTLLVVPAGSLDTELAMSPQGHIYISRKADWDKELEKVVQYDELPPSE